MDIIEITDAAMRGWAHWYKILVTFWAILGLPGAVVGYGFAGGDIISAVPTDPLEFMVWLPVAFFLVSPIALWPWRKLQRQS